MFITDIKLWFILHYLFYFSGIIERSLSASVEISFDLNNNDIPAVISGETDVYKEIKYSVTKLYSVCIYNWVSNNFEPNHVTD